MQMRQVFTICRSNRPDGLTALYKLILFHKDFIAMRIERFYFFSAWKFVNNPDYISPTAFEILCYTDFSVGNRKNRIAQIGISATCSVPVFTQMMIVSKMLCIIISFTIGLPNRKIKSIGKFSRISVFRNGILDIFFTRLTRKQKERKQNNQLFHSIKIKKAERISLLIFYTKLPP